MCLQFVRIFHAAKLNKAVPEIRGRLSLEPDIEVYVFNLRQRGRLT
jgi:hypothetical protein